MNEKNNFIVKDIVDTSEYIHVEYIHVIYVAAVVLFFCLFLCFAAVF